MSLFLRSAMDLLVMAGWWEPVRGLLVAVAGPFSPRRRRARVKHGEPGLLGGEVLLGSDSSVLRGRKVDDALPQHAGRRGTGDGGRRTGPVLLLYSDVAGGDWTCYLLANVESGAQAKDSGCLRGPRAGD